MTLFRFAAALTAALGAPLPAQEPAAARPQPAAQSSIGVDAGFVSFDDATAPWRLGAVSLMRRAPGGTVIGRVNVANRFGSTGVQYEADAYPRLGGSSYAYLNAGWSRASIFPAWRYGAELFTALPHAYEASLGVRHLRFAGDPVTLVTASAGKYLGNYWLSLRPYVRRKDNRLTASGGLTVRRYEATADDFLGVRVSVGSTPGDPVTANDLARTRSVSAGLQASRALSRQVTATAALGYERETLDLARRRNRLELNAGARVAF